jgi:L-aspartate oxidase
MKSPNIACCDDKDLSRSPRNVLAQMAKNAPLDHIRICVLSGLHLKGWHLIPLYHVGLIDPVQRVRTEFIVVGAGVAGLRAAIELAAVGRVLVIAKYSLRESSSEYAQGGIAAALSDDDDIELHEQDTLVAGDGLCDPEAVRILVEEGPAAIEELIAWGTAFDREGLELQLGREGAHSRNRILHAHGDSTGREIVRALRQRARELENVSLQSFAAVTDLLVRDGEVLGVVTLDETTRSLVLIEARGVLLATGGLGRVFENTTNPDVATGDGVACAFRAGAAISDIEFVQFHPTALYVPNAPRFLLSEALRGEGAYLRNASGERFMERYHPLKELAPRDVVSRSIVMELRASEDPSAFLDLTHLPAGFVRDRFPRIYRTCLQYGVDLETMPAPVRPAAHYAMGGVSTNLSGKTSLARLYAAGEVACTGVHGANRLASNSLLEAVVFGRRAGRAMCDLPPSADQSPVRCPVPNFPAIRERELRAIAWNACGILRNGPELQAAHKKLQWRSMSASAEASRDDYELRNIHQVALLISQAALAREESRGGHYRTDFPHKSPSFEKHSLLTRGSNDLDAQVAFV